MGLECGECERDLRGGHDIGCFRYDLVRGVCLAMATALGIDADDEADFTKNWLTAATAAIARVREHDEARRDVPAFDAAVAAGRARIRATPSDAGQADSNTRSGE